MVIATDKPERIIRRIKTTPEWWFQTTRTGHRHPVTEKAQAMQAWSAALNDETDNKDKVEELEDYLEQPNDAGAPLNALVTRPDVKKKIDDETRKETATMIMR